MVIDALTMVVAFAVPVGEVRGTASSLSVTVTPWASARPAARVLAGRIERLPEPAVQVVGAAAVAGDTVSDGLLRAIVDDHAALSSGLRALVDANVMFPTEAGLGYRFRHALLREAILSTCFRESGPTSTVGSRWRSRRPHARRRWAARALAPLLATHWYGASDRPKAPAASVNAARVLADKAVSAEAMAYFERALSLWATVPNPAKITGLDHPQLLIEAARACEDAGDYRQAADHLRAARSVLSGDDGRPRRDLVMARLGSHRR